MKEDKKHFFSDLGFKVIALILAIITWLYVRGEITNIFSL
jgi:YbbR domain-containing protein